MKELLELFLTFVKIGAFTFGGGYAMLSLIEDICVEKKKWITHEEMMDITVIAESTPGPIAINCSTYVGYKKKKLPGAIFATVGIVLPSFFIIFLISKFLDGFLEITWVANAFHGIKIAVGILIVDAAVGILTKAKFSKLQVALLIAVTLVILIINVLSLHISSLIIMLFSAVVGVAAFLIKSKMRKEAPGDDIS